MNKFFNIKNLLRFTIITYSLNLIPYQETNDTPLFNYTKPCIIKEKNSGLEKIDCIYLINLDERPNKLKNSIKQFENTNIKFNRFSAINGWKLSENDLKTIKGIYYKDSIGSKGSVGCLLSHLSIYKNAKENNFNIIWIVEDDFCIISDVFKIPQIIKELENIDPDWHILYTDLDYKENGNYIYVGPSWVRPWQNKEYSHYTSAMKVSVSANLFKIRRRWGTYSMIISKKGIAKLYNYYKHLFYFSPIDNDIHHIDGIKQYSIKNDIVTHCNIESSTQNAIKFNIINYY